MFDIHSHHSTKGALHSEAERSNC